MENLFETVEAILFSAGVPLKRSEILNGLPDEVSRKELNAVIEKIAEKYSGDSGIVLEIFNDKLQFASNSKYGETVSDMLRPIREKELSKVVLEVLSIIAYRQPITRSEIEDSRGSASADYALGVLLKVDMIKTCGYKDAPGKPILYGTTDEFLKKFQLRSLDELPDYDDIMRRLVEFSNYNIQTDGLYRERVMGDKFEDENDEELNEMIDMNEIPEFLQGEDLQTVQGNGEDYVEREVASDVDEGAQDSTADDDGDIVT